MSKRLEIIDILMTLNKHKVKYAIAGGVAVFLHGFVSATKDIDIILDKINSRCKN
ncbi:MAG: hypothetical protein AB1349_03345 [Elusimicrobiota bacterium]